MQIRTFHLNTLQNSKYDANLLAYPITTNEICINSLPTEEGISIKFKWVLLNIVCHISATSPCMKDQFKNPQR